MSEESSWRKNAARKAQSMVGAFVIPTIRILNTAHLFQGTAIERRLFRHETLSADDLTLSQLEMTSHICRVLETNSTYSGFFIDYLLANALDGVDGLVARRLKSDSPEGGMRDVLTDRLCEAVIAKHITRERNLYRDGTEQSVDDLTTAFQLSTLSKAACEMCGVETSEGGIGSILERRRILYGILRDLATLKANEKIDISHKSKLLNRVDINIELLITNSKKGAIERIDKIASSGLTSSRDWTYSKLSEDKSAASKEARKYAAVILMNGEIGIDTVAFLNKLAGGKIIFPTAQELIAKHPYINLSLESIKGFYNEAMRIANINSSLS